ncbi:MAG: HAD family hydrolase [Lachnospiraceae bacterium]|nr:HAD family hydrolase [Lachnospiraceae bacterium]
MGVREDLLQKRIFVMDLDGTLIDSRKRHAIVMQEVLAHTKRSLNAEEYMTYKAEGNSGLKYLTEVMGIDMSDAREIQQEWMARIEFSGYLLADELYPDAVSFLNTVFEKGGVIFLTARKNRLGLDGELKRLAILPYADYTIVADPDDAMSQKEKAVQVIREAYPDAKLTVIGDTENEYELARKFGLESRIVNCGFRSKAYWEKRGVKTYSSLGEVLRSIV